MLRRSLLFAVLLMTAACSFVPSSEKRVEVARIGKEVLYEEEIVKLMPGGTSPADSALMVRNYVDGWAIDRLLQMKARQKLSKEDQDLSAQVAEYERSLLNFRFRKVYVEERIDTSVTKEEVKAWYAENGERCRTSCSVVRARVTCVRSDSPFLAQIRKASEGRGEESIEAFEKLCRDNADSFSDFGGGYVALSEISEMTGVALERCEELVAAGKPIAYEEDGVDWFACCFDCTAPGEKAPLEYMENKIKETIISRRRQELLSRLERDLLMEALDNKTLKIYTKDE